MGLVASLLLSKFRIRHLLAEQEIAPAEHPKAHFWLKRRGVRISVLDLPHRMMGSDGAPVFILITSGSRSPVPGNIDAISHDAARPVVIVVPIETSADKNSAGWAYHPARPAFLPSRSTLLMRPDGHIDRLIDPRRI